MQCCNGKEYLEKILAFAEGESKCIEEAEKIINAFGGLDGLANTEASVLKNLSGCSEKAADFIRLIAALSSRRITDEFKNGKKYSKNEIERYICALTFHRAVESVYMLSFDKGGRLISTDLITEGTVNSSAFLPRKIADIALRRHASRVIIAHNHPSGNINPSDNDISVTLFAKTVLSDVGITLDAHYITVGFTIIDCMSSINLPLKAGITVSKVNPLA